MHSSLGERQEVLTLQHKDVVAGVARRDAVRAGDVEQGAHILQRLQLAALVGHAVHIAPVPDAADNDLHLRRATEHATSGKVVPS